MTDNIDTTVKKTSDETKPATATPTVNPPTVEADKKPDAAKS